MKKNYNYGKLIDGKIEYAPYPLIIAVEGGNRHIYNATAEQYREQGYKLIVMTVAPKIEENQDLIHTYRETENEILIEYSVAELLGEENA